MISIVHSFNSDGFIEFCQRYHRVPMSNLFEGEAKGEIIQLRDKLDGNDPDERKEAAKRCIAIMRAGENVSSVFTSMLRCVKTTDI